MRDCNFIRDCSYALPRYQGCDARPCSRGMGQCLSTSALLRWHVWRAPLLATHGAGMPSG